MASNNEDSVVKTLVASLATPTTHKQHKLTTLEQRGLHALKTAFENDCDTQSKVNDVVTPYDLPYQVKDALKNHVPDLLDEDTYDAETLKDDQPVRFVNRAARFDHDESREHSYCWRVPQPGRGTDFWIPLAVNPDHDDEWHALATDDENVEWNAGQLRLQRDGETDWELHVTVTKPADDTPDDVREREDVTPVGFDVGESQLVVGCALRDNTPVDPLFVDGGVVRDARHRQQHGEDRLKQRDADTLLDEYVWGDLQNAVDDELEKAAASAVEYAAQFNDPVVVLEDLSGIDEEDLGGYWNRRLGKSLLGSVQDRIEDHASERGIPVVYVNPRYTSQTCHACNRVGNRPHQGTFECPYSECWVSEYQCDLNAAAKIAQRLNPWGESLPVKSAGDDSPYGAVRSGAPVTEPEDTDESETTLGEGCSANPVESSNTVRAGVADDKIRSSSPAQGAGGESETSSADASSNFNPDSG